MLKDAESVTENSIVELLKSESGSGNRMLQRTLFFRQADRRTRHHMSLDGQVNPREWFNWHPREFLPYYYDKHKFVYERSHWSHVHHLLCHQVYLKDMLQLAQYPEPSTWVIDVRTEPSRMHRWFPHSNWLPRDEVDYALQLDEAEFIEMYGFRKPPQTDDVILLSHDGRAAEETGWEFKKCYYTHVYNFRGGTNELYNEKYEDFGGAMSNELRPWKGPYPSSHIFIDAFSRRKVLTRTGPFDKQYEFQEFALPDLEAEKPRHSHLEDGPRSNMPWGLQ